jgi:hypothetical protein
MAYLSTAELRSYLGIEETTTFTASASTNLLTLSSVAFMNTLSTGTEVELTTTASDLPDPLAVSTVYYVHTIVDQTCALATTSALATAGTAIVITDAGTGTHTITRSENVDTLLTNAINAAQAYIEGKTNRVFEASASTTKYYSRDALDDDDSTLLHLDDDNLTITELLNGDSSSTEITSSNYWLLDRNLGPPYHWVKLKSNTGVYWEWDIDEWVAVTGTWGRSATVPSDVKEACTMLAAFLFKKKDSQVFDTTAIPEAGVITIPSGIPTTVVKVIARYKRYL